MFCPNTSFDQSSDASAISLTLTLCRCDISSVMARIMSKSLKSGQKGKVKETQPPTFSLLLYVVTARERNRNRKRETEKQPTSTVHPDLIVSMKKKNQYIKNQCQHHELLEYKVYFFLYSKSNYFVSTSAVSTLDSLFQFPKLPC